MRRTCQLSLQFGILIFFMGCGLLAASDGTQSLLLPEDAALHDLEMPPMGDSDLEQILERYYTIGLGGSEGWSALESLQMTGTLKHRAGKFSFKTLMKKPSYCKQTLVNPHQPSSQKGYNGRVAWRTSEGEEHAYRLPDIDGHIYALNAHMGSHLLFPYDPHKRIELINTVPYKGFICHKIKVSFHNNPVEVLYWIDVSDFVERKRLYRGGDDQKYSIEYASFERLPCGVPFARTERHFDGGKLSATLHIETIRVNTGMMPWMFHAPKTLSVSPAVETH